MCTYVDAAEVVLNKCVTFYEDPNEDPEQRAKTADEKPIHLDYQFIEDELAPWKKRSQRSISKNILLLAIL